MEWKEVCSYSSKGYGGFMMTSGIQEWSRAAVKLLQGPVYSDSDRKTWNQLIRFKENLDQYFSVIGLHIVLEEDDGYAFLEQLKDAIERGMEYEDDNIESLPRLIRKAPLSYSLSMLLVLLRQESIKFVSSNDESECPIIRKSDILGFVESYTKEYCDQTKFNDDVDRMIKQLISLTYLKPKTQLLSSEIPDETEFEISPIIKSKIDVDFMNEMLLKMKTANNKTVEDDLLIKEI